MINIAICDDMEICRTQIGEMCNSFFNNECNISFFEDGEALLDSIKEYTWQIIFLDIKLSGISGIEVKNILELESKRSMIIFITSYDSYMKAAFGRNVCGFVQKLLKKKEIYKHLEHIIRLTANSKILFMDDILGKRVEVSTREICYVNADHIYTQVALEDDTKYIFRKSLAEWEDILDSKQYIRIHKSYIVNLDYVVKIGAFVQLANGKEISVRRGMVKKLKEMYWEYKMENSRLI